MAEEAIGLAKSLSWTVEWGPSYLIPQESSVEVPSSALIPTSRGRDLGNKKSYSVENEELKNWDRVEVYGTGMKWFFWQGRMLIDLEESDETEDEMEGDEWTNPELRQSIAASSMLKVRNPLSPTFFGSGKVNSNQISQLSMFISEKHITTLFINTTLTPSQQRNLER